MTVLLLGGTGEARQAAKIARRLGSKMLVSLAGATRSPALDDVPTRIGGFGGDEAFRQFLQDQGITAILDMTHPFATKMTARAYATAQDLRLDYLRFERPVWTPAPDDRWINVPTLEAVAAHIADDDVVFLATGRQSLDPIGPLPAQKIYCRQIDPPEAPFPWDNGEYLVGRAPFATAAETELFQRLGVTKLVTKNAGGAGAENKLIAARALGLTVLMIDRPPLHAAPWCDTMAEVETWLNARSA